MGAILLDLGDLVGITRPHGDAELVFVAGFWPEESRAEILASAV